MNRTEWIACVAADSAGHIFPCLTLAQQEQANHPADLILFITANRSAERSFTEQFPSTVKRIYLPHIAVKKSAFQLLKFFFNSTRIFFRSLFIFFLYRPRILLTTGGALSVPVCLAAWLLRIPISAFELNAHTGKAFNCLAPLATRVLTCFATAQEELNAYNAQLSPYPVRSTLHTVPDKKIVLQSLGLDETRITLLIVGGSQGSVFLNNAIEQLVNQYQSFFNRLQLIHQTGKANATAYKTVYKQLHIPAYVCEFDPRLDQFLSVADLVICRSGAGTLFELIALKKRCITIPLITAHTAHQLDNALHFATTLPEQFTLLHQSAVEQHPLALLNAIKRGLANYPASYQN